MQDIEVALDPHDRMLLDALMRLKAVDDTLSFRRSCREGVCGSDAMNINGKNGLACITNLKTLKEPVELKPLPGLPGDPRPDRGHEPVLQASTTRSSRTWSTTRRRRRRSACSRRRTARNSTGSTSASSAPAARPPARRSGGTRTSSSVPPGLLAAYRFIADTRDEATGERLDNLEDPYRLFRCHSIMNCVDVCPKGLNPTRAIGKIKDILVKRAV